MVSLSFIIITRSYGSMQDTTSADTAQQQQEAFINDIEEKVRSTLLFGGSSPVGFSGEGRLKIQYHNMIDDPPPFMRSDRSWIQSGWEGNQALLRLGMIVSMGRNVTVYTKIGFQNTLPGIYINESAETGQEKVEPGFVPVQTRHDQTNAPAYIHEDMTAGIALRTRPASLLLKFGGLQWIETSPLTVWDYQRRLFAWDFLPYEVEEPIATYYDKNVIKGERTGRATWNKKPFNGIGLESITLPYDLYLSLFYGSIEPFDRSEREYIDLQGDRAYYHLEKFKALKGFGIGDPYRHVIVGRIAQNNLFKNLTPGINFITLRYDPDVISNSLFVNRFSGTTHSFYKEPIVLSTECAVTMVEGMDLRCEAAFGRIDTSFFALNNQDFSDIGLRQTRSSGVKQAFFTGFRNTHIMPVQVEAMYSSPGFYSPFSFAKSVDGFSPFGANLVGPGKYVTSAYNQNLTGFVVHATPPGIGENGHCKITYGHHGQIKRGPDILFFPYRLNGADLFSVFQSSYTRWGYGLVDNSLPGIDYQKRVGDESYMLDNRTPQGPEAGGLRADDLKVYEGFVPYEKASDAQANLDEKETTVFQRSQYIPQHKKYTFNLELDAAYDVASLFRRENSVFLSVYIALNGVSTSPQVLVTNEKGDETLLWGSLIRFEPAVSLSERFYFLGLAGFENWRAKKAWMADDSGNIFLNPIDFRDAALGLGFDWQMLERVGLHGRCKWMQHTDVNYTDNNWKTPVISAEIKMYF
jgi:hypothetical protein